MTHVYTKMHKRLLCACFFFKSSYEVMEVNENKKCMHKMKKIHYTLFLPSRLTTCIKVMTRRGGQRIFYVEYM
jgi:hypothetical protein